MGNLEDRFSRDKAHNVGQLKDKSADTSKTGRSSSVALAYFNKPKVFLCFFIGSEAKCICRSGNERFQL